MCIKADHTAPVFTAEHTARADHLDVGIGKEHNDLYVVGYDGQRGAVYQFCGKIKGGGGLIQKDNISVTYQLDRFLRDGSFCCGIIVTAGIKTGNHGEICHQGSASVTLFDQSPLLQRTEVPTDAGLTGKQGVAKLFDGDKTLRIFENIDDLINASVEDIVLIDDFGDISAHCVADYFALEANIKLIEKLKSFGVDMTFKSDSIDNRFEGMVFVLSGGLESLSRNEASAIIEKYGGKTS